MNYNVFPGRARFAAAQAAASFRDARAGRPYSPFHAARGPRIGLTAADAIRAQSEAQGQGPGSVLRAPRAIAFPSEDARNLYNAWQEADARFNAFALEQIYRPDLQPQPGASEAAEAERSSRVQASTQIAEGLRRDAAKKKSAFDFAMFTAGVPSGFTPEELAARAAAEEKARLDAIAQAAAVEKARLDAIAKAENTAKAEAQQAEAERRLAYEKAKQAAEALEEANRRRTIEGLPPITVTTPEAPATRSVWGEVALALALTSPAWVTLWLTRGAR